MKLAKLKSIIKNGETESVEFKKSTAQLPRAMETICAFLNNQGGIVFIGVTATGDLAGQDVADKTKQIIAHELDKLEPPAQVSVHYVDVKNNKKIIVFEVKPSLHAPYLYDGRPYYRAQSTTKQMTQQRYDQLVASRLPLNFSWEKLSAKEYTIENLDNNLILNVIRHSIEAKRLPEEALHQNVSNVLQALELMVDGQLRNAAIPLFAKKVFPSYPQCQLKMARFKGTDRDEFLDMDLVYGNVFELLEKGLLFVRRHLPLAGRIEAGKVERIEEFLIPFKAIREALINALCHRDYSSQGGSIGLAIYDDRMEIFNDGGLPSGVTLEKIKTGFSKPRNALIADVFYKYGLIEKWGRGIPKIINSCKAVHDPEPEFYADEAEFKILFRFPGSLKQPVIFLQKPGLFDQLTPRQREIVEILTIAETLKMREIMRHLKDPPAERTLRDDLASLKGLGVIDSTGHARTTKWFLLK